VDNDEVELDERLAAIRDDLVEKGVPESDIWRANKKVSDRMNVRRAGQTFEIVRGGDLFYVYRIGSDGLRQLPPEIFEAANPAFPDSMYEMIGV